MSEQEPCGVCCDPSSAWLGITAPTAANGNGAPSRSQPGRALFPSHPRPHRKALKKARSDTKAATPTQCMGYSALTRDRECLDHAQGDNSQHSHPENLRKNFFGKAKKHPEIGYFTPVFYPQRIFDLKVVTKISTGGKTLEKTELLPKVIRISCSDGTSCQMFSSPAARKSVTTKQNIPSCRQKGKLCCWSSDCSRKRTTHKAKFLFPCIHVRGNEPESKARSLLRARFPFPLQSLFPPCTQPSRTPSTPHLHTSFHVPSTVPDTGNTPKRLFAHSLHHIVTTTLPNPGPYLRSGNSLRSAASHNCSGHSSVRKARHEIPTPF